MTVWVVDGLAELSEELLDAPAGAAVTFDLAVPAVSGSIERQLLLDLVAGAETRRVVGRGDEFRAGEVEVALTRALGREAKTAT